MPTSISRAAGMAMTKALSHELAPHNVLVNAMLVGFIRADQHVQLAKRANITVEEYYKAHEKEIPIGRAGEAEEFANLACFMSEAPPAPIIQTGQKGKKEAPSLGVRGAEEVVERAPNSASRDD
jgi:NAD(P)-dependent dehydrogenase (short-subunit alcohol dehydrogenase family)